MKKFLNVLVMVMLVSALLLSGCGTTGSEAATETEDAAKAIKVGFIYVGPVGDGGWTYAHNEAKTYLENELGVETLFQESVPEGQEVEQVIKNMIDQGVNVIFATSFGYMDYVESISAEYPEVAFLHCSGYKTTENMGNYFGRMYEARYLSGIVAGMKTETNKIGYVAAYPISEVVRGINAFTLGVQSVNPEAIVDVRWTNTWYDPAKEKEAGRALLDADCDIIAQHQDTTGPQQAAAERGMTAIGYNTDSSAQVPDAFMTAPVWNWGPYYLEQVKAIQEGTWAADSYWGGLNDGIIGLAPLTDLAPEGAQAKIDEVSAKIIDGSFKVFAGPIKNQAGEVVVAEGSEISDGDLLQINWFVQGVRGNIE